MKASVQHRLDRRFHLEVEQTIEPGSFVFCGHDYSVPCVFQIWVRKPVLRVSVLAPIESSDFQFVDRTTGKFAIQRIGVNAGRVKDITDAIATSSHYFISASPSVRYTFEQMWSQGAYQSCKYNTAGNPSIGKRELIAVYESFDEAYDQAA